MQDRAPQPRHLPGKSSGAAFGQVVRRIDHDHARATAHTQHGAQDRAAIIVQKCAAPAAYDEIRDHRHDFAGRVLVADLQAEASQRREELPKIGREHDEPRLRQAHR